MRGLLAALLTVVAAASGCAVPGTCLEPKVTFRFHDEPCPADDCTIDFGVVPAPLSSEERVTWKSECGWIEDAEITIGEGAEVFTVVDFSDTLADEGFILVEAHPEDDERYAGKLHLSAGPNELDLALLVNAD